MSVTELQALAQKFSGAFDQRDVKTFLGMLSEDVEVFDHVPYRFDGKPLFAKYLNELIASLATTSFGFRQPSCRVYGDTVRVVIAHDTFTGVTKDGKTLSIHEDTKNLPGHKSDVQESQWPMKLHTYGLLRNSFRPSQGIRTMRTYWRQRNDLVRSAGRHIRRIQKAMTQVNIQLANVLSDVSGMTGQAIIKAILSGERDPHKLAAFRDPRVKASEEEIARSLEGNWQGDLLFVLQQEQDGYECCQKQMAECDQRLEQYLQQREDRSAGANLPEEKRKDRRKKKKGNKPLFDLRSGLFRMTGTDLTRIDGVDVMTAITILSEAGCDMSKCETEDHFVSWLRLCPDNRISGDKIIGKGRLPTNNRVSTALQMPASTLRLSKTYLGAQFRRLRSRLDTPVAIKAMAAKLARWSTACCPTE